MTRDRVITILLLIIALICFFVFALIAHGSITTDEGFTWLGAGLFFTTLAKLVP